MIDFAVRQYDTIGSTNEAALRLARDGAVQGTVLCAREQTEGRGRHGRHWHSPAGNLYASIVLRPTVPPACMPQLSFVVALAVADLVDRLLPDGPRARLKWPNDVQVNAAKIAGILIEYADGAAVVGIGLNLAHAPGSPDYPVTTITACRPDRADVATPAEALPMLLAAIDRRYGAWLTEGFAIIRRDWLARAHPAGTPLRVTLGAARIDGSFIELAEDGALILATKAGRQRIVAGDVRG